jgi:arylsulfatase A-like enzyme
MVGEYISAIEQADLTDSTIFVLSSDHGDMQVRVMKHDAPHPA